MQQSTLHLKKTLEIKLANRKCHRLAVFAVFRAASSWRGILSAFDASSPATAFACALAYVYVCVCRARASASTSWVTARQLPSSENQRARAGVRCFTGPGRRFYFRISSAGLSRFVRPSVCQVKVIQHGILHLSWHQRLLTLHYSAYFWPLVGGKKGKNSGYLHKWWFDSVLSVN